MCRAAASGTCPFSCKDPWWIPDLIAVVRFPVYLLLALTYSPKILPFVSDRHDTKLLINALRWGKPRGQVLILLGCRLQMGTGTLSVGVVMGSTSGHVSVGICLRHDQVPFNGVLLPSSWSIAIFGIDLGSKHPESRRFMAL